MHEFSHFSDFQSLNAVMSVLRVTVLESQEICVCIRSQFGSQPPAVPPARPPNVKFGGFKAMPAPKPAVKAPAAKAMPKTTDHPPKPVGWFLVNSTVTVAEVYDVADLPLPCCLLLLQGMRQAIVRMLQLCIGSISRSNWHVQLAIWKNTLHAGRVSCQILVC